MKIVIFGVIPLSLRQKLPIATVCNQNKFQIDRICLLGVLPVSVLEKKRPVDAIALHACLGAGICMLLSACVLFYFICLHIESYMFIDAIAPFITTHRYKR